MKDENYGIQRDWGPRSAPPPGAVGGPVSVVDERSWAALAHLSALLNLFTGFLGPAAAFVLWLVGLFIGWSVTFFLTAFVVGILLWPVMGVLTLAFFGHALYEAYLAYKDEGVLGYH